MPEFRQNPITGRWVIISTDRARRPGQRRDAGTVKDLREDCPFCYSNESMTPPEVYAIRDNGKDTPGWRLRIVPNKYPALDSEAAPVTLRDEEIYLALGGAGFHEVVIETPDHDIALADMPVGDVADIFESVRRRFLEYGKNPDIKCVHYFKNHGVRAGATLSHPHSQIIALPVVSPSLMEEIRGASKYYEKKIECPYCDIVKNEIKNRTRHIGENEHCVAVAPYAPRFQYETWILPKRHGADFSRAPEGILAGLADMLKNTMTRINMLLAEPAYNLMLHTAPFGGFHDIYYHWHLKIAPAISGVAGFEWSSGIHINPVPPENAAELLRDVL